MIWTDERKDLGAVINGVVLRAESYCGENLSQDETKELSEFLDREMRKLEIAFDARKRSATPPEQGESDGYFREKLVGLFSFAKMAVRAEDREGYECPQIIENTKHFAYLVKGMLKAD